MANKANLHDAPRGVATGEMPPPHHFSSGPILLFLSHDKLLEGGGKGGKFSNNTP